MSTNKIFNLINKVSRLGIDVTITNSKRIVAQAATIRIVDGTDVCRQIPFTIEGTDVPSPFSWEMSADIFMKWGQRAIKFPYSRLNRVVANLIRTMDVQSFDKLRQIPDLFELVMNELRHHMADVHIKVGTFSRPALIHLTWLYGWKEQKIESFIVHLLEDVLNETHTPDMCSTCQHFRIRNGKRYCVYGGFELPDDIQISQVLDDFPDVYTKRVGKKVRVFTNYIPEPQKDCDMHYRRF